MGPPGQVCCVLPLEAVLAPLALCGPFHMVLIVPPSRKDRVDLRSTVLLEFFVEDRVFNPARTQGGFELQDLAKLTLVP